MSYAVKTENLSKVYGKGKNRFFALKDVNLAIRKGEIFSVLGPNGAGKTTLLKILSTLILPTSGNATVNGYDIIKNEAEVRRSIGFSTGYERSFYYRLSGYANLLFFGSLYGIPMQVLRKRIDTLLEEFELEKSKNVPYMKYSNGMKKKLSIIRAFLHNPDLFIFDEPMSSLDAETVIKVREKIFGLKQSGKTVIVATHNMKEAEIISDRIAIMDKGKIKKADTTEKLKKLLKIKIVEAIFPRFPDRGEIEHLKKIAGERSVKVNGKKITCYLKDEGSLTEAVRFLQSIGLPVFDITIRDPDLEKVFVSLIEEDK